MTLGILSISRADVELDFDFAGQTILGSVKLQATLDTDSISNKFCLHCRHITVQSITINGAACIWNHRDQMAAIMLPQDGEYRDTISYSARLREAVNRSVVGELEIFLPPSGVPRGGSCEIVITCGCSPLTTTPLLRILNVDFEQVFARACGGVWSCRGHRQRRSQPHAVHQWRY